MRNVIVTENVDNGTATYGIEILADNGSKYAYSGLSTNNDSVRHLAENLMADDIADAHIEDIVRDFIIGESYDKLIVNNMI